MYDLAAGYHHRVLNRQHLIRSSLPLYLGRVGLFVMEAADLEATGVEERLERLCLEFESAKPHLAGAVHRGRPAERVLRSARGDLYVADTCGCPARIVGDDGVAGIAVLLPRLLAGLLIIVRALVLGLVAGRLTSRALRLSKVDIAASRLGLPGSPSPASGWRTLPPLAGRLVQWGHPGGSARPDSCTCWIRTWRPASWPDRWCTFRISRGGGDPLGGVRP